MYSFLFRKINYADLEIKEKLGEGSFSSVYKGVYNNEDVAIKRLRFNDEQLRESHLLKAFDEFRNEVFLMRYVLIIFRELYFESSLIFVFHSGLKHPNIVKMAGFCTEPNYCIVTEYVGGGRYFAMRRSVLQRAQLIVRLGAVYWSYYKMKIVLYPGLCVCA